MFVHTISTAKDYVYRHVPENIINQLVRDRQYWRDLEKRLYSLPEISLGKYIGTKPSSTPHKNAVEYSQEHESAHLYVGYIIYRERTGDKWQITEHSFCVENGKVCEPTEMPRWNVYDTHYVGMEVPEEHTKNMKYLHYFDRMSYINEHSSLVIT